jgi:hypothetical protein
MTQRSVVIIKIAIWAGCLAPFALLVLAATGVYGTLGANGVEIPVPQRDLHIRS